MTENEALKEAIAEYKENLRLEKLHLESHNFSAPLQNTIRENIRDIEWEIKWLEEIQQYRAMEQRLKKVYGECDGLLEVVVSGLERHENLDLPYVEVKSVLLIDEDVDKWNEYRAIGTIEEFKALKEKNNKDFELLLKAVKESYPMFKGAYVELDVFMGDVMRRFTRDRKQS